jgi:outer membrane protein TolC
MDTTIWSAGSFGWAIFLSSSLACAQSHVSQSPARSDPAPSAMRVTLHDAVARALARNPTYATAVLEARRADAVVRETKAAWLPTVYSYGSVTHLDGIGADATRTTSADVRRLVAYSTGQTYLAVYAQKLVIEVDERARDTAKSHAAYAHQRYAGGVGNSIDEVRAAQEAASDDALVQQAYALLASDEEALGIVAGSEGPLDTGEEPTLDWSYDALRSSRDAAQLASQALELANTAYRAGATTNIEVIDAERQARDAATQAEMAADGARQARLTMLVAADRFPERRGNST